MKKLDSVAASTAVFYLAPDLWLDARDTLPLDHDLFVSQHSGEACMISATEDGAQFVSVGERIDDWIERRRGTTV